jgi:hypothetical protein
MTLLTLLQPAAAAAATTSGSVFGFGALSETPISTVTTTEGGATNVTALPGAGSLTLTGFAPTVTAQQNVSVSPGIDTLVLTGLAPTVSATQSQTVTPGVGSIVLTGYPPTVTVPNDATVATGLGSLTITGYAPSVVSGPDVTTFDYHDGRPKIDWEAPERRVRRERELIREAIQAAMLEASGVRPQTAPDEPTPPPKAPAPLSKERRRQIAQTLLGSVSFSNGSVAKLERSIARIEKSIQRQIEIEREIEEEDEMILLLAA